MTASTRLWMYRAGEARLFEHPDEVPAGEGWQRFPAVAETPAPGGVNAPAPAPRRGVRPPGLELPNEEQLSRMSRQRLMQVAASLRMHIDFRRTKAQLKQAIAEVLYDNRA
jgi:hypothetical protein